MWTLVATVFVASVLGSLHCAGMCGAFLAIALGDGTTPKWAAQGAYHGGRLATYLSLGALAGAAGGAVNLAGGLAGVSQAATVLAGVTLVVFAVVTYLRLRGVAVAMPLPGVLRRASQKGYGAAMRRSPVPRAAIVGLLTTLLPCGWLYAFVAVAAGTASAGGGATAMLAFWAGTLPLMTALGLGVRGAMGTLGAKLPAITCGVLLVMGLVTLTGRAGLSPVRLLAAARASSGDAVQAAANTTPACCVHKPERAR